MLLIFLFSVPLKKNPGMKDVILPTKSGNEQHSTVIEIKNLMHFNYLRQSNFIKQAEAENGVHIECVKSTEHQGFKIQGTFDAIDKIKHQFKKIIEYIQTCSLILKSRKFVLLKAQQKLVSTKRETEQKFDVLLALTWQGNGDNFDALRNDKATGEATKTTDYNEVSKSRQKDTIRSGIRKTDAPDMVSWHFPRGYRISLQKLSVSDVAADVHVQFTNWTGKAGKTTLLNPLNTDGIFLLF